MHSFVCTRWVNGKGSLKGHKLLGNLKTTFFSVKQTFRCCEKNKNFRFVKTTPVGCCKNSFQENSARSHFAKGQSQQNISDAKKFGTLKRHN